MPEKHAIFHSDNGKRNLLIIEDEMINQEILRFMLQDTYNLAFADNGAKAIALLDAIYETLSLVLLDLNLPDMQGRDILAHIRNNEEMAAVPVIVMTSDQGSEVECLDMGAVDFIPKPYPQQDVILARLRRTIELAEDRSTLKQTERDHLTGLLNREFFIAYASQFDTYHKDTPMDAALVDINQFHMLNERYGRDFGDEILKQVAQRIRASIPEEEGIVSRRDADTFIIYCTHREEAEYQNILENASIAFGENNRLRLRMGVYPNVDKGEVKEHIFDRAKLAADTVKDNVTTPLAMYSESMHENEVLRSQLLEGFDAAIREKQFKVYYQPKFNVTAKEPILNSAEALVRWSHPKLGMISPGVFIPLFEKNGLIRKLDSYVWREAANKVREWKGRLGRTVPVSVNVSRVDLYDPELLEELENILAETQLSHDELFLEITESAYTENSDQIISVVGNLQEKGFHIEMDDFGTGYSSLVMISSLPIDALKLDMQFIRNAFKQRKDIRLLDAIIGLAKAFDLPTIAEGVETAEQMFTLKSMGCDVVQGYYFSRPLPADEFEQYIDDLQLTESALIKKSGGETSDGPQDRYTYEAMHDPLTGLYNQSAFEILFHDADHDHIAVMVAHVDNFEQILAEKGRAYANQIIQRVARVLRGSFRSVDNICHLQESEFVIIMSRMTSENQQQVFEKIEQFNRILKASERDLQAISLSVGIAFSDREEPQGDVFKDAATALQRLEENKKRGYVVY